MTPTAQQQDFLAALRDPRGGHLALKARAGCGKTSTILLAVDEISHSFPHAETLVCAFNKSIADEVGAKLKKAGHTDWKTVDASTLHSLGWGLVRFQFRLTRDDIDEKKVSKLVDTHNGEVYDQYRQQIIDLVGYAKGAGFGFFPEKAIGNIAAWHELADHYDVNGLEDTSESDAVVEAAQVIYRASLAQTTVVDFDDMILFPLVKNMRVKFGKDFIFGDEWQDMSAAKQALVRKFLKPGGRLIMVGDDRQAIYGFAGADSAAMDNGIRQMGARVLPLSVTWRCPKAVVAVAQRWVPDIEAAPSAPEGIVRTTGLKAVLAEVGTEDAILCRNTAPLVEIAYKLIRAGKPVKVEGRAIGDGLINLARRWKVKSIDALLQRLEAYRDREIQKAMAKNNEAKAEEVADKVDTLVEICGACTEQGRTTIDDVVAFINNLFADGAGAATILATYHRSKGREWGRVYLYEHSQRCPSRAAKQEWQLAQEDNLAYVAVTRAMSELIWVDGQ